MDDQLSFVDAPRIALAFHAGAGHFAAIVRDHPGPVGRGETEALAISALARRLQALVADQPPTGGLTAFAQVLVAADRLPRDELEAWLLQRAEEPVVSDR